MVILLHLHRQIFSKAARAAAQAPTLTYGFAPEAGLRAEGLALGRSGTSFRMRQSQNEWVVRLRLLGRHNVYNCLSAAAACEEKLASKPEMRRTRSPAACFAASISRSIS